MIEINITNCIELAKSKSYLSELIPSSMLQAMVEKAIAKKLLQKLTEEGVGGHHYCFQVCRRIGLLI